MTGLIGEAWDRPSPCSGRRQASDDDDDDEQQEQSAAWRRPEDTEEVPLMLM